MSTNLDERILAAATGALELFGIHLGTRLVCTAPWSSTAR